MVNITKIYIVYNTETKYFKATVHSQFKTFKDYVMLCYMADGKFTVSHSYTWNMNNTPYAIAYALKDKIYCKFYKTHKNFLKYKKILTTKMFLLKNPPIVTFGE